MMFRSNNQWVIALLLCGRLVVSGEPSHPVHFTKTTIEYSQSAQSVTIMIEAYGEDFEYAIKRRTGRGVDLQRAIDRKLRIHRP
jgi:uncharacterized protein DUF6702